MTRVTIRSQGPESEEPVTVEAGEAVLIGRRSATSRTDDASDVTLPEHTRSVQFGSPSVSAQHLLIEHEPDSLRLTDLGSRNGTWLQLPPRHVVTLAPVASLGIHLAAPARSQIANSPPPDAVWTDREDYVDGVVRVIDAWLGEHRIKARIAVVAKADAGQVDQIVRIPVTADRELVIVPMQTVEGDWFEVLTMLEKFVMRQSALLAAEEQLRDDGLIVASAAMRRTLAAVVDAAIGGARTLLLIGPSGSGKEGLARCFHRHTGRSGPFVARNCAMFSRELARSELFGAERGAFTGAVQRIIGAVEAANEGSLFLDEIAELPADVQPMLLRVLDRGEYERIGRYDRPCHADVRIVSATNKDLRRAALEGQFRTDLWFRLSTYVIEVPPLRDRFMDIAAYLRSRALPTGRSLYDALSPEALDLLKVHAWEGNFRELINFAERTIAAAGRGPINAELCRRTLDQGALQPLPRSNRPAPSAPACSAPPSDLAATCHQVANVAFAEDYGINAPRTWDEVKEFIENYLKPALFAHLSGCSEQLASGTVDLRRAADRLRADRGTASKQLERYIDRFVSTGPTAHVQPTDSKLRRA